jgi:hypothetical protein
MDSMNVTAIRKNGDSRDTTRDALREAITQAKKAEAAVEERRNAIERARDFVGEVQGRIEEAIIALNNASEEHAGRVAAAIAQGEKPPAATAVKAAKAKLNDYQDDELVSAEAALERIGDDLGDLQHAAALAENAVLTEIAKLMQPVAERLLERAQHLKRELLSVHMRLWAITDVEKEGLPGFVSEIARLNAADARQAPISSLRAEVTKLTTTANDDEWRVATEAAQPWRRAKLSSRTNADSGFPE